MKEIQEIRNSIFKRQEILFNVQHSGTPNFISLQQKTAEHFKVEENLVVVKGVRGSFGRDLFHVKVFIYDSLKDKENIEPKVKVKKNTGGIG